MRASPTTIAERGIDHERAAYAAISVAAVTSVAWILNAAPAKRAAQIAIPIAPAEPSCDVAGIAAAELQRLGIISRSVPGRSLSDQSGTSNSDERRKS